MTCGVCIGTDIHDFPEFCNESDPIARKDHECCECWRTIPKGEKYHRISGKWDGDFTTHCQCAQCHEIQVVFSCGEGYYFGGLWESWEEADGFRFLTVRDPCFNKLSNEARKFLTDRWWKWKETHRES